MGGCALPGGGMQKPYTPKCGQGKTKSRKKIGGFHLKKNINDVITRKQMTVWNFI
jgi:hypothetical protein